MSTIYRQIILDHYQHPRNYGEIEGADQELEHDNPSCGDRIKIHLKIKDGTIEDISFSGEGCALSTAGASLLLEHLKGKKMSTIDTFTKNDMYDLLQVEVSPAREKCATLAMETLKKHS